MNNTCRSIFISSMLIIMSAVTRGQFDPPRPRLLVSLNITDGTSTVHDTLGCDWIGSYCIDGMIDTNLYEQELPMIPPMVFDARFVDHRSGYSCLGFGLRLHIQTFGLDTFRVSIHQPNVTGYPISISWNTFYSSFGMWTSLSIGKVGEDISTYVNMLTDSVFYVNDTSLTLLDIIASSIDFDGVEQGQQLPEGSQLFQNFPNPFNPQTTIRYYLPSRSVVTLSIYDLLGRKVYEYGNPEATPGFHNVEFDARSLVGGTYMCILRSESAILLKKLLYIK